MAKARPNGRFDRLSRSEIENVIFEANLGKENTQIAQLYFIEQMPQIEIAGELRMDRKTVGERLKVISAKMQRISDRSYAGSPP